MFHAVVTRDSLNMAKIAFMKNKEKNTLWGVLATMYSKTWLI
jgi:hypothetical protein